MTEPASFPDALRARYTPEFVAGVGGMSVVFAVTERSTGARRAVKLLNVTADVARARREVMLLMTLAHPGLVAVVDAGDLPDGRAWIVMDWLDGETLAARLKRAALCVADAVVVGETVAGALGYLHATGVVHRDVKPSNILLVGGDPARATLLDLGIARGGGADLPGPTATGAILGTPGYMAPEQVRDPRRAGPASDVFSLGCVMFHALAGREAFTGGTSLELVAHALHSRAPKVLSVESSVPAPIAALVDAMLDPDASQRPRDGDAVASALAALRASLSGPEARQRPAAAVLSFDEAQPTGMEATLASTMIEPAPLVATSAFVGRRRELGLLDLAHGECLERRRPAVALVTAAAGLGKSRLADAWVRRLDADVTVLRGRAEPTAFGVVSTVLRAAAGGDGATLGERLRGMARADLGASADEDHVELLARLAGLPSQEVSTLVAAERDRTLMAARLRAAWLRWIDARSARGPTVLALDDLHDADPGSVELIALSTRRVRGALFVLGLRRPVEAGGTDPLAELATLQVALSPLSAAESERLARALLGDDADAATVESLVSRAAGHPTVLEELARVSRDGTLSDAPATVRALLHARLAALDGAQRRALRAASVFGSVFWRGALGSLLGGAEEPLDRALAGLERADVAVARSTSRFGDEPEWSLRSALLAEVAYETLTEIDRGRGHALAARWLVASGEWDARAVATHLLRGGLAAEAAPWLVAAAERCLDASDWAGVLRAVEEGAGAGGEAEGVLRHAEAVARKWRGEMPAALEAARAAVAALSLESGRGLLACAELTTLAGMVGDRATLLSWAARLLAEPVREATRSEHAIAVGRAAMQMAMAMPAEAPAAMAWLTAHVSPELMAADPQVAAWTLGARGFAAMVAGDAYGCAVHLEQAAWQHARMGDLKGACSARTNAAFARATVGQYAQAEASLRTAAVEAEALGLSSLAADIAQNLGDARLGLGDLDGAMALADEALAAHVRFGATRMEAATRTVRARVLLAKRAWEEAAEEAAKAYALGAAGTPRRALASAAWARALAAQGRSDEALARAEEARAVEGLDEGQGQVWIAWVEALAAAGRADEARAAAGAGLAWVEETAAKVDDAEARETMRGAVPEHAALRAWGGA